MAITGLSKQETTEYISEKDPCKSEAEGATVFMIGAVDKETIGALKDGAQILESVDGTQRIVLNTSATMVKACRVGLRGWRNFKDAQGKDIPFKTEEGYLFGKPVRLVTEETMSLLPYDLIMELGRVIVDKNSKMDATISKN